MLRSSRYGISSSFALLSAPNANIRQVSLFSTPVDTAAKLKAQGLAITKAVLTEDEDGEQIMIDRKRSNWERNLMGESYTKELMVLGDSHMTNHDAAKMNKGVEYDGITYRGSGVYKWGTKTGVDLDAAANPATLVRPETFLLAEHAIQCTDEKKKVVVVGQPGIGKTRSTMTVTLAALLQQGRAVARLNYKENEVWTFLPQPDGSYRSFLCSLGDYPSSTIFRQPNLFTLADPPESRREYDDHYKRFGLYLKFASNNLLKHYLNWLKDGRILCTLIPSVDEVVAMSTDLWDIDSPLPWQTKPFNEWTDEEIELEVLDRCHLVGPIPRLVYKSYYLENKVIAAAETAERLGAEGQQSLLMQFSPKCTTVGGEYNHENSAMYNMNCNDTRDTWEARRGVSVELNGIAAFVIYSKIRSKFPELPKPEFEQLVAAQIADKHDVPLLCRSVTLDAGYNHVTGMTPSVKEVFVPGVDNFPGIDYAITCDQWGNAKSYKKGDAHLSGSGLLKFLKGIKLVDGSKGNYKLSQMGKAKIEAVQGKEPPCKLTIVTSRKQSYQLNKCSGAEEKLIRKLVSIETEVMDELVLDATEFDADHLDKTRKLLVDYPIRQYQH